MDSFRAITVFIKVAESRNFTAAAGRLGITPSAASRLLGRLEDHLGVRLVNRTTRAVSLTTEGEAFFERCRQIVADLEDAEAAVQGRGSQLRGRLRVRSPVAFGRKIVVPLLAQFLDANRGLCVDLELTDHVTDAPDEGVDLLVRIGEVHSTSVVARRLCDLRFVTVASPDYLARFGEPSSPDDLHRHRCLAYYVPQTHRYRDWRFGCEGDTLQRPVAGWLNVNSADALLEAALAGAGIASVSTFIAADAVKAGHLRIILRDFVCPGPPISLVYLSRRHLSARLRAVIEFLAQKVSPVPHWDAILE